MRCRPILSWFLFAALAISILSPRLTAQPAAQAPPAKQQPAAAVPAVPLTAAFVDRSGSKLGTLLEGELLEMPNLRWVERTEIKKILAEQALDRAFGSGDIDARLKLGKLLQAEVLILFREIPAEGKLPTRYELAVCETRRGLRLGAKVYAQPNDGTQRLQATILADIKRALAKQREQITRLVAISPLLNDSLTRRDDALQKALATLIEEALTENPGLLVVELQEARAIANEKTLTAGAPVEQSLVPHFIQGKFRFANNPTDRRAVVELELRQGTKLLAEAKSEPLLAEEIPAWLLTTSQLFTHKMGLPKNAAPHDRKLEIAQLNARARDFTKLSNWHEAATLAEASLLLDPRQREMYLLAIHCYSRFYHRMTTDAALRNGYGPLLDDMRTYEHALELYERLQALDDSPLGEKSEYSPFGETEFENGTNVILSNLPQGLSADIIQQLDEFQARRRATYWRILDSRLERGLADAGNSAIPLLIRSITIKDGKIVPDHRCQTLGEILERLARSPNFNKIDHRYLNGVQLPYKDPVVQAFYDKYEKYPHPGVQSLVSSARKRWTPPPGFKPAPLVTDNPDRPEGPEINELELTPLDWPAEERRAIGYPVAYNNSKCLPLDNGCDIYLAKNRLLLMKQKDQFETLFTIPSRSRLGELNDRITEMAFDGKYVWVVNLEHPSGSYRLFAIDLETKKTVEFLEEDGYVTPAKPIYLHHVALAPLAPGKVFIAADIGRDWYGIATLTAEGKRTVEIFHESKERTLPNATPEQTLTMAMRPRHAYFLKPAASSKAPAKVIVVRSGDSVLTTAPWLVVDPETKKVSTLDAKFIKRSDFGWTALPIGDKLWFETREPGGDAGYRVPAAISTLALDDLSKTTPHAKPHGTAYFAANRDELHTVGNAYQIYSFKDNSLRTVLAPVPWHYSDPYRSNKNMAIISRTKPNLAGVFYTNHYGFIVVTVEAGSSASKTFHQVRAKTAAP